MPSRLPATAYHAVVATDPQGNKTVEFTVSGTPRYAHPSQLGHCGSENKSDGTLGRCACANDWRRPRFSVVDSSGNAITGTGTHSSRTLDGSVVHADGFAGAATDVALE